MSKVKNGDTVKVHYTGTLDDGTVFDSSREREPLQFEVGGGMVIPGFDKAVDGMAAGESKSIHIPADEAYGPYREEMVLEVERDRFPEDISPEVGMQLQMGQEGEAPMVVQVTEVTENHVKLDANHPLAGKDLNFDLELVEVA